MNTILKIFHIHLTFDVIIIQKRKKIRTLTNDIIFPKTYFYIFFTWTWRVEGFKFHIFFFFAWNLYDCEILLLKNLLISMRMIACFCRWIYIMLVNKVTQIFFLTDPEIIHNTKKTMIFLKHALDETWFDKILTCCFIMTNKN